MPAKPKPLDSRTLRAVARWCRKRKSDLDNIGLKSHSASSRLLFFHHAEAHLNMDRDIERRARAINRKKATGKR